MESPSKKVYIISYPRSGNTWVRLLLEYSLGFETSSVYAVEQNERKKELQHPLSLVSESDRHLVRSPVVALLKSHAFAIPDEAPVIYVLRDGRDATASYWDFAKSFWKREVGSFSSFLRQLHATGDWWPDHVYQWLVNDVHHPKIVIRFEDLIDDPGRELGRMLRYLNLEPVRSYGEFSDAIEFEKLHGIIPSFFRQGKTGGWRDVFDQDDEKFFSEHGLGMLCRCGYEDAPTGADTDATLPGDAIAGWINRYQQCQIDVLEKEAVILAQSDEMKKMTQALHEKEDQIRLLAKAAEERLVEMKKKDEQIRQLASRSQDPT